MNSWEEAYHAWRENDVDNVEVQQANQIRDKLLNSSIPIGMPIIEDAISHAAYVSEKQGFQVGFSEGIKFAAKQAKKVKEQKEVKVI